MRLDQSRAVEFGTTGDRHFDFELRPLRQRLDDRFDLVDGEPDPSRADAGLEIDELQIRAPRRTSAPSSAKGAVTAFSRMLTKTFQMMGARRNVGSSSDAGDREDSDR